MLFLHQLFFGQQRLWQDSWGSGSTAEEAIRDLKLCSHCNVWDNILESLLWSAIQKIEIKPCLQVYLPSACIIFFMMPFICCRHAFSLCFSKSLVSDNPWTDDVAVRIVAVINAYCDNTRSKRVNRGKVKWDGLEAPPGGSVLDGALIFLLLYLMAHLIVNVYMYN